MSEQETIALITRDEYRFTQPKRYSISKGNGKGREIYKWLEADGHIMKKMNDLIYQAVDPHLHANNVGFRRGRQGSKEIVKRLLVEARRMDATKAYLGSADIEEAFDRTPHRLLKRHLRSLIDDEGLRKMAMRPSAAAGLKGRGVPQGAPVSPILFLTATKDLLPQVMTGKAEVYQYADDFTILAPAKKSAQRCKERLAKAAGRIGLPLNKAKTKISPLIGGELFGFEFIMRQSSGGERSISAKITEEKLVRFQRKTMEKLKSMEDDDPEKVRIELWQKLRGWESYYSGPVPEQEAREVITRAMLTAVRTSNWERHFGDPKSWFPARVKSISC